MTVPSHHRKSSMVDKSRPKFEPKNLSRQKKAEFTSFCPESPVPQSLGESELAPVPYAYPKEHHEEEPWDLAPTARRRCRSLTPRPMNRAPMPDTLSQNSFTNDDLLPIDDLELRFPKISEQDKSVKPLRRPKRAEKDFPRPSAIKAYSDRYSGQKDYCRR